MGRYTNFLDTTKKAETRPLTSSENNFRLRQAALRHVYTKWGAPLLRGARFLELCSGFAGVGASDACGKRRGRRRRRAPWREPRPWRSGRPGATGGGPAGLGGVAGLLVVRVGGAAGLVGARIGGLDLDEGLDGVGQGRRGGVNLGLVVGAEGGLGGVERLLEGAPGLGGVVVGLQALGAGDGGLELPGSGCWTLSRASMAALRAASASSTVSWSSEVRASWALASACWRAAQDSAV